MTEAEIRVEREGSDEESMSLEAEAQQVEASALVVLSGIPKKEAAGSDSNAEPSATVLDVKGSIPEKEEGRKEVTIECEKGSTPSTNTRRKLERKKKVAGNDNNAEPSRTVPVKVEEQASAIMMNNEDKAGEGGNKEQAAKGETVDEGIKEAASSSPASRIQKRKKVTVPVATTSADATAEATKDNEEKTAVADEGENTLSKEDGEKEDVPDERKKASTFGKKAKRLQKKKTVPSASAVTAKDNKEKTNLTDKVGSALSKEEGNKEVVSEGAGTSNKVESSEEMETNVLTTATSSAAITAETANDGSEKAAAADEDKGDGSLNKKNKKRKKKNKTRVAALEGTGAAEVEAVNKPSVTKQHAGMIFMCNAETKRDCYRYKVFGMPAAKKETVEKVYKGMKLFLYDIDLKLMYGVYIASSKGGYNIQPKAFKSAFPSQVRFKVLKDYLPLPEEKFKAAIKTNYYKNKKFNLELSAEQVNKLSKLFVEASKVSKRTNGRATRERAPQNFASHGAKRMRLQGAVSRPLIDDDHIYSRNREGYSSQVPLQVPFPPPGSAVPRHAPFPLYSSPPRLAPYPPPAPPVYMYERPREFEHYSRELPMESHGFRIVDSETGVVYDYPGPNDPYSLHREPAPYHETRYPPTLPASYHAPAPPPYRY